MHPAVLRKTGRDSSLSLISQKKKKKYHFIFRTRDTRVNGGEGTELASERFVYFSEKTEALSLVSRIETRRAPRSRPPSAP